MPETRNYEQAVIGILREIAGPYKTINEGTRIYEDLLISGDDAVELINRIHKECGTSFQGFNFSDYFYNEAESLFYRILLLFGRTPKKTLSVRHLLDVVKAGAWFEEGKKVS